MTRLHDLAGAWPFYDPAADVLSSYRIMRVCAGIYCRLAHSQRSPHSTSPALKTSMPGVFTAGDVRQGSTKQAASATGEGATAALMIREYLKGM